MEILDWGQVTPEATSLDKNEVMYVYNHDLTSPEKVDRTIRFIIGRLNYYDTQLPTDLNHVIKIDVRGQQIGEALYDYIKKELLARCERPKSVTINIIK